MKSDNLDLLWTVLAGTVVVSLLLGFVVLLLVLNNTRRVRHRAELAELKEQQAQVLMEAEREAMQHTLRVMGRELHDNIGQLLFLGQYALSEHMEEQGGSERLNVTLDALDRGLEEVRRLGRDLNNELWQERSLEEAIRSEAERLVRVARVQVQVLSSDELPALDADTKVMLFRLFQVILNNALRHSAADHITVELRNEHGLALLISDNGKGFDPARVEAHAGLKNIHTRSALIGYTAQCTTAPGAGCTWHLRKTHKA
ncbi:MAG: hypothetical protein KF905_09275 [Flavobacteriales bacterium]|nr:hypothetical protein [Flavobacteriales bacterium]